MIPNSQCKIDGCTDTVRYKKYGWCSKHYCRYRAYGDPLMGGTPHGAPYRFLLDHVDYEEDNCLIWPFSTYMKGYGQLAGKGIASTVMCELAHGPKPSDKDEAAHKCGNPPCVNPTHLYWATFKENQEDRYRHAEERKCL